MAKTFPMTRVAAANQRINIFCFETFNVIARQKLRENDAYLAYMFAYGWRITRLRLVAQLTVYKELKQRGRG